MKRHIAVSLALIALLLLFAPTASAVCQKCLKWTENDVQRAQCWTIPPTEMGATFGACWVTQTFKDGQVTSQDCAGSPADSECNKPSGTQPPGGGGGGGGGQQGCVINSTEDGLNCPAECSICYFNIDIEPGE